MNHLNLIIRVFNDQAYEFIKNLVYEYASSTDITVYDYGKEKLFTDSICRIISTPNITFYIGKHNELLIDDMETLASDNEKATIAFTINRGLVDTVNYKCYKTELVPDILSPKYEVAEDYILRVWNYMYHPDETTKDNMVEIDIKVWTNSAVYTYDTIKDTIVELQDTGNISKFAMEVKENG